MNWTAIWAGLKALPEILKLLQKLGDFVKEVDLKNDFKAIEEAHDAYTKAKTTEERMAAMSRIARLGKRL